MRILFLSNFYPPARPGGYTQWCYEVAERLRERGHTIGVLTSSYERHKAPPGEAGIFRTLHLDGDLFYYRPGHFLLSHRKELRENLAALRRTAGEFAPDLVFVWGMWALSKQLPALAERLLPGGVVYYLCDYWPAAEDMHTAYWRAPAQRSFMRLPKILLSTIGHRMIAQEGRPDLAFEHAICVSAAVRRILVEAGVPVQHAAVIHGGTDIARFREASPTDHGQPPDGPIRLLYAGQLVPHKGVHTAVEAIARLVHDPEPAQVHLALVGSGHPDYEAALRALVAREGLESHVHFHGPVGREEMATLMGEFDVLVFPSIYEEPLARTTQEAMAAGLVVIGTTTGGTGELLVDGENGLVFEAGDAAGLARQVRRLADDPALRRRLAMAGQQTVREHFTLDRMVDRIESYLTNIVRGHLDTQT